jgi:hypothetical protein
MDEVQIAVDEIDSLISAAHNEGFGTFGADAGIRLDEKVLIVYWKGKEYRFTQAHDDNWTFKQYPCPAGCTSWDDCDESCR